MRKLIFGNYENKNISINDWLILNNKRAFGCVMYEMIELKKAFDGTFFQITSAINSFQTENLKLDKVPELFKNVLNKYLKS